jgi:aspartate/methionine/tyrosine aminotransferase/ribosomal protein S18 acetylase RimI-like enzyme
MIVTPKACNKPADIAACAAVMAASPPWSDLHFSASQCLENLSSPQLELYVVKEESRLVGFIATRATGMEGEPLLEYVCVSAADRGRGIGTQLMHFFESTLYPTADNLYLFVSDINPGAIRLYERLGYVRVGELPDYNLIGQTEYLYRKYRRPRQERFRQIDLQHNNRAPRRLNAAPSQLLACAYRSLTEHQNEGFARGALDLATGYPRLPIPEDMAEQVLAGTRAAMVNTQDEAPARRRLFDAVARILNIDSPISDHCRVTFSGSVALDRVFAAIRELSRQRDMAGCSAVVSEPCIDLYYNLLSESPGTRVIGIRCAANDSRLRTDQLLSAIESESHWHPRRQLFIVLDSPANPFGSVTTREDLDRLADACRRHDAILVVDHCFLLTGVHTPARLPTVFDIDPGRCDWIGVWDTGKSMDLAGDKVGIIVSGSPRITAVIDESLAVIQPSTFSARRTVEVFGRVLAMPTLTDYFFRNAEYCRENLRYLSAQPIDGWRVHVPQAGNFACIENVTGQGSSDVHRDRWLQRGLSAAAGRTFLPATIHAEGESPVFMRLSLLRTPEYFRKSMDCLLDA